MIMSKRLRSQVKKVVFSVAATALVLGSLMPINYLMAATTDRVAVSSNTKEVSAKVKDTTIIFEGVSQDPTTKKTILNVTLKRDAGIPKDINDIWLDDSTKVTIDGKEYKLLLGNVGIQRISDTEIKAQFNVAGVTGDGKEHKYVDNISLDKIKGKSISMALTGVRYVKNVTEFTEEFKAQLKNVAAIKGVSAEEAGIGWIGNKGNVIPKKGLNIPMFKGAEMITLDNIGIIDGKLELRVNESKDVGYMIEVIDGKGKQIPGCGYGLGTGVGMIETYDGIKDAATLSKCKVSGDANIFLADDGLEKEEDAIQVTCTF